MKSESEISLQFSAKVGPRQVANNNGANGSLVLIIRVLSRRHAHFEQLLQMPSMLVMVALTEPASMLATFVRSTVVALGSVPTGAASCYGLLAAADKTGFDDQYPAAHQKAVLCLNYLLYILVEHLVGYILACMLAGFIWALMVAEPKSVAKRKFRERLRKVSRR